MSKYRNYSEFQIASPCGQAWDEMKGNEKVRVCEHCEKEVNNVSAMTRKDAVRLIRASGGNICLRYYRDPKTQRPIFIERMQRLAAQSGVSAGVLTASIAFSGAAYAQTESAPTSVVEVNRNAKEPGSSGSVTGVVTDPNGAVIPYALVSLTNEATMEYRVATANFEGYYEFKELPTGTYKIKFEAGSFKPQEYASVSVADAAMVRRDAQLTMPQVGEVVEVGGDKSDNSVNGGAIFIGPSNPLVQAAMDNDLEDVKARVMMRARVNVRDKAYDGISPLHAAIENGNIEMVQFLLDRGAKTNIRDFRKRTPLMMMDEDATPELLQLMLRYGARLDVVDKEGNTMLMHFAECEQPEILRYLTMAGISLNAKNKKGETALMIATDSDRAATVKALLEAGADANLTSAEGETALTMTHSEAVRTLLVSFGAVAKSH